MQNSIVKVDHLFHRYSVDWAVKDISFEIQENGILGLLGSNGAGKSTVMNIMCGVLNQTSGSVEINGIDTRKNPVEAKKQIGFLPQKAPLYFDNTVDEYLSHCAYLRLMDPLIISTAMETVKKKCGISHFSNRLIKNLSGGYQQRVGIAASIIHNPKLVVLDEPTNGLDPVQIGEVRKIIQEIGKERAVIFSSHILSEVAAVCDEIKMIEHGNLVFSGTVNQFNNYIEPNTILATFQSPPDTSEILDVDGVHSALKLEDNQYRLEFNKDQAVAEKIIETSVAKGWHMRELVIEKSSLDDVFAKISRNLTSNDK